MDFKEKVFQLFKERIANGKNVEAAIAFYSTDFPEMSFEEFDEERKALDMNGYIKKMYYRGFSLSNYALEEIEDSE